MQPRILAAVYSSDKPDSLPSSSLMPALTTAAFLVSLVSWIVLIGLVARMQRMRLHYVPLAAQRNLKHLRPAAASHPAPKSTVGGIAFVVCFVAFLLAMNFPELLPAVLIGLTAIPPLWILASIGIQRWRLAGYGQDQQVLALALEGDPVQALRNAREALELHGPSFIRLNGLGIVLCQTKEWAGALAAFEEALGMNPPRQALTVLTANRAWAMSHLGRAAEARATMPEVIRSFPFEPHIRANYCLILVEAGDLDEARTQLKAMEELADVTQTKDESVRERLNLRLKECRDAVGALQRGRENPK